MFLVSLKPYYKISMLSVVIVTYNSQNIICNAILHIINKVNIKIYVVDNASQDDTVSIVKSLKGNNIEIIESEKNIGYGPASNLALKKITSEYVLLLNPDAEISYENIINMENIMNTNNDIGILSAKLTDIKEISISNIHNVANGKTIDVNKVIFAVVLIKMNIFRKIGLFDPNIFMYFEDFDVSKRFLSINLRVCECLDIFAYHKGGGSSTQNFNILYIKEKSREIGRMYYKMKHFYSEYNFYCLHLRYLLKYTIVLPFYICIFSKNNIVKNYARSIGIIKSFLRGNILSKMTVYNNFFR